MVTQSTKQYCCMFLPNFLLDVVPDSIFEPFFFSLIVDVPAKKSMFGLKKRIGKNEQTIILEQACLESGDCELNKDDFLRSRFDILNLAWNSRKRISETCVISLTSCPPFRIRSGLVVFVQFFQGGCPT